MWFCTDNEVTENEWIVQTRKEEEKRATDCVYCALSLTWKM